MFSTKFKFSITNRGKSLQQESGSLDPDLSPIQFYVCFCSAIPPHNPRSKSVALATARYDLPPPRPRTGLPLRGTLNSGPRSRSESLTPISITPASRRNALERDALPGIRSGGRLVCAPVPGAPGVDTVSTVPHKLCFAIFCFGVEEHRGGERC